MMHVQWERFIQQLKCLAGKDTISVGDFRQSTRTKWFSRQTAFPIRLCQCAVLQSTPD